ncbi:hypothetical protein ACEH19_002061 [Enterobacter hormaechei]|uniref:hypothetical protein n=1 Tax=Enterobacter hormaechei TaxID=158836 RepID=UPI000AB068D3|nr:hypothetical protein [Enterobacter hormaechei]EHN8838847.1 hypothetical protein [Enterobacter hormaechei]EKK5495982.1 hypothetical protein [Enterobacter hormaechei]EMA4503133.1 hypothetical protein [Enterobacter hormaechei]EMF0807707.1 hypothetical protein [Enterobacter hormaechei]MBJ6602666.1 hypothetical protein [Enterobacter hormaechei]
MKNNNYQLLTHTFQRLSRFSHLSSIASWDMFTMIAELLQFSSLPLKGLEK